MAVIVVGEFRVKGGAEGRFEAAFEERPPAGGSPAPVHEVLFGRSQTDPGRYLRVGVWASREEWEAFQNSGPQRAFWDEVTSHLGEEPAVEFYELRRSWRAT